MSIKQSFYIPLEKRIQTGYRMVKRKESGEKISDIASDLHISRTHLKNLEEKYRTDPTMKDKERAGRPLKADDRTIRRIVHSVRKQPYATSNTLTREINTGVQEEKQISPTTFRRIALKKGLKAYRPCVKPNLTPDNVRDRLLFARQYENRTNRFWCQVIFADETRLTLHSVDTRLRVRVRRGERASPNYCQFSWKYGGGSIMFWSFITWAGQGPLVLIEGNLNGKRYAELLEEWIPDSLENLNILYPYYVDDHAGAHIAQIVENTKVDIGLRTLNNYPSNSPDLNPIENVWSFWKDKIRARNPQTLEELEDYAYEEWARIPLDYLRNCIRSMSNRLQEVVRLKGLNTRY